MDINKAYEILEFDEPINDIGLVEKRYEKLLKKYKYKDINNIDNEITIKDINYAYKEILNSVNGNTQKKYTKFEIIKNNLDYYKVHIIIITFITLFLSAIIHSMVTKEKVDFELIIEGSFMADTKKVAAKINKLDKNIEHSQVSILNFNKAIDPAIASASETKSLAMLMAKEGDIYILDQDRYNKFIKNKALNDLSLYVNLDKINNDKLIKSEKDNDIIYGIDITDSSLINKLKISGEKFILVKAGGKKFNKKVKSFIENALAK